MASQWSGELFVFKKKGVFYIAATLPAGVPFAPNQFQQIRASGPYMPVGMTDMTEVEDIEKWFGQMQQEGFVFSV